MYYSQQMPIGPTRVLLLGEGKAVAQRTAYLHEIFRQSATKHHHPMIVGGNNFEVQQTFTSCLSIFGHVNDKKSSIAASKKNIDILRNRASRRIGTALDRLDRVEMAHPVRSIIIPKNDEIPTISFEKIVNMLNLTSFV